MAGAAGLLVLASLGVADELPLQMQAWEGRFGTHYDVAPWAGTVRDPLGPGRAGYWAKDRRAPREVDGDLEKVRDALAGDLSSRDVVLGAGGLGSGRNQRATSEFLDEIVQTGGRRWQDEIARRVRLLQPFPGSPQLVVWQFGNEINGPRFRQTVTNWLEDGGAGRRMNDPAIIPVYVEMYLAPGVESLRRARASLGEPGQRIRAMLGSLGNARSGASRRWFSELMDYRIRGDYAASLAGMTVAQILDGVSLHYLAAGGQEDWRRAAAWLEEFRNDHKALKHIWITEELGIKRAQAGYGAGHTLRVLVRYLTHWQEAGWNDQLARCVIWGGDVRGGGQSGNAVLTDLDDFFGSGSNAVRASRVEISATPTLEAYAVAGVATGNYLVTLFSAQRHSQSAVISGMDLVYSKFPGLSEKYAAATARVVGAATTEPLSLGIDVEPDRLRLEFPEPLRYGSEDTVLIKLFADGP